MDSEKEVKLLSLVDILEPLSVEETNRLRQRMPVLRLERGQTLYTPRYAAGVVFLLLEGRIRLYKVAGGQELTLEVIEVGTMFGEVAFAARPQGAYAEALEPSRVGVVSLDSLGSLVRDRPEVALKIIGLLSERLHLYGSRMADIGLKEVPARLASLILRLVESEGIVTGEGHYKIPTRYTHEQLATMIGAKRVAVTRAFSKFRKIGALELDRRYICVRDAGALERAAGGELG